MGVGDRDFTRLTTLAAGASGDAAGMLARLRDLLAGEGSEVFDVDGTALILTAGSLPPVVDDAYTYGAIAANAACGDVFARGGQPALALHLAAFPRDMPAETAAAIIRGGAEKAALAGAVVAGRHLTTAPEPTYGLAVLGRVAPEQLVHTGGLRHGDRLVLTKPVGTGVITEAGRQGTASAPALAAAVDCMLVSNAQAATAARLAVVHGGIQVGGGGLVGSALELAHASRARLALRAEAVPLLRDALHHAGEGTFPGATSRNEEQFARHTEVGGALDPLLRRVLFSPEMAGGLLLAVPSHAVPALLAACGAQGGQAAVIGEVGAGTGLLIE